MQEVVENRPAVLGVHDFGMKLHAVDLLLRAPHRRDVAARRRRQRAKPAGSATTESPCDIQTRDLRGTPSKSGVSRSRDHQRRRAVLGVIELDELGAEIARKQLHAVADAEDRNARLDDRRRPCPGAPATSVLSGPPDRMIAAGSRGESALHGVSCGTISQ